MLSVESFNKIPLPWQKNARGILKYMSQLNVNVNVSNAVNNNNNSTIMNDNYSTMNTNNNNDVSSKTKLQPNKANTIDLPPLAI